MKYILLLICTCGIASHAFSQAIPLWITTSKTTSLIFPVSIEHADRGTKDILMQQVLEADNILLVKAAVACFPETNLTVITSDGHLYSFLLNYNEATPTLIYQVPSVPFSSLQSIASGLLDNPAILRHVHNQRWDMKVEVAGIYVKDSLMFYQLRLVNNSPINYDIETLHFSFRDKRRMKRTAVQEQALTPLYIAGTTTQVKAGSCKTIVVVLDKFTIPDQKTFFIEAIEKNGGRHLRLKVQNRMLLQAHLLE